MALAGLLFLTFGAALKPRSKKIYIFGICYIWLMYSFLLLQGDLQTYEAVYQGYVSGVYTNTYEPLFSLFLRLCARGHFPFRLVRIILATFYVFFLKRGIDKATESRALALSFLAIFPLFYYISVLRAGLASAIILCGLSSFQNKTDKKDRLKYIGYVALATTIHYSSIIFFAVLFIPEKMKETKLIKYFVFSIALALVMNRTNIMQRIVSSITSSPKVLQWFTGENTTNLTGTIVITVLLLGNALLGKMTKKKAMKQEMIVFYKNTGTSLTRVAYSISVCTIFILPLMISSSVFMRIAYVAYAINMISLADVVGKIKGHNWKLLSMLELTGYIASIIWLIYCELPYIKQGGWLINALITTPI